MLIKKFALDEQNLCWSFAIVAVRMLSQLVGQADGQTGGRAAKVCQILSWLG